MRKNDTPWTAAELEYLRAARSRGVTGRVMAAHLGRSRNAVLGKAHREKIEGIRACEKPRPRAARLGLRLKTRAIPAPEVRAKPRANVTLMDLRADDCRWPMWDAYPGVYSAFYCAAGVKDGAVYCPQHTCAARAVIKNPAGLARRGV